MKNYNQLFIKRFNQSQIYDNNFSNICNTDGLKEAIKYLKAIGATVLDVENYLIKYRISKWTQNDLSESEKKEMLEDLLEIKNYVKEVKFINNKKFNIPEVNIETNKGLIRAMQFSLWKPKVKDIIPNIEDESRFGNCYKYAYYISVGISLENYIVTGYIWGYSDKAKFLHSWVELDIDGEEYVIDATLNVIMNKEGYYLMQHAEPINKIDNKTFFDDLNSYPLISKNNIPLEVYYVFRNEIIDDLKKNDDILKK